MRVCVWNSFYIWQLCMAAFTRKPFLCFTHCGLAQTHCDPRGWPQPSPQVVQGKAVRPEPVSTITDCSCPGVPTLAAPSRRNVARKNIWQMWSVISFRNWHFALHVGYVGFLTQKAWTRFISPLWKTGGGLLKTSENQCRSSNGTYSCWFSGPGLFNLDRKSLAMLMQNVTAPSALLLPTINPPKQFSAPKQIITEQCSKPSVVPFNPGLERHSHGLWSTQYLG